MKPQFQKRIPAGILGRVLLLNGHGSKAGALIEPESRKKNRVGFKMDSSCSHPLRGLNGSLNQFPADASALIVFVYSHLAQLILRRPVCDECAAANWKAVNGGEENSSPLAKDRSFWISKDLVVLGFKHEVTANPSLVQRLEGGLISLLVRSNDCRCLPLRVLLAVHLRSVILPLKSNASRQEMLVSIASI